MAPPGKIAYIPTFYRIFFLYIDPLINFSSLYLFFFDHATYISQTIPKSILPPSFYLAHPEITPLENHLITALGSYSIAFLALQISLIHGFKNAPSGLNVKIWKILNGAILLTDLGLLVGGYLSDPAGMVNLAGWGSMEWGNYGALGVIAAIRAAFLLGIGGVGKKWVRGEEEVVGLVFGVLDGPMLSGCYDHGFWFEAAGNAVCYLLECWI